MNELPVDVDVLAAGAVLWRPRDGRTEVCLVHRPRYDDWSFPKGKLEDGESLAAAAVREVREETGVAARLGPFLCDVRYTVADGRKLVRYWSAQACSAGGFTPNDEVDELRWLRPDDAHELLSYARDADVLARFTELGPPTSLLVLVRHANGFVTAYAHASELSVKKGETVKRGQVIGKAGATGNVTSPQLHFEVRKGATPVDPTQYLSGG